MEHQSRQLSWLFKCEGMCLQPYADKEILDKEELKRRTAGCVELMLIHCRNLCNWAGLNFSSFFSSEFTSGNVVASATSASLVTAVQEREFKPVSDDFESDDFSMVGSKFEELEIR